MGQGRHRGDGGHYHRWEWDDEQAYARSDGPFARSPFRVGRDEVKRSGNIIGRRSRDGSGYDGQRPLGNGVAYRRGG